MFAPRMRSFHLRAMFAASRLVSVLFSAAALMLPASRTLAAAASPSHVQASLVAAETSIQPGHPVTVALRFVHDPHWHTYWVNPGTGLPTSLSWKLPPGWK